MGLFRLLFGSTILAAPVWVKANVHVESTYRGHQLFGTVPEKLLYAYSRGSKYSYEYDIAIERGGVRMSSGFLTAYADGFSFASKSVNLRPTGNAWFYFMAQHVTFN